MINAKTKLCCIIGNPVKHSLSPLMHNAAYRALGLNFVFVAFDVIDVKTAILGLKSLNVAAIVVTVPHKIEVRKYVDQIDKTAEKIGAVNTIINNAGILKATNTDWFGAIKALKEQTQIKGKTVALLGAGGAARALIYGLKKEKVDAINVFNRNFAKAEKLVKEFRLKAAFPLHNLSQIRFCEIIINSTSVGLEPEEDKSPLPANYIKSNQIVFDIVYTPRETPLLKMAKKAGAKVVYGDKMVLYGGIKQFELITGKKAPKEVMEKILQVYSN